MHFRIDERFRNHFRNLKQVFLYITDECNLACVQCIYKPSITFQIEKAIRLETVLGLLSDCRDLGASKLTILGGEPTLYGSRENHQPLLTVISEAKVLGYEYVRIDTNGQFPASLLEQAKFKKLDEIAFSLDGLSAEMNDAVRGKNTFAHSVGNIQTAGALGYKTTITCCVHNKLLHRAADTNLQIDSMISFAQSLGVSVINFHDLFKVGVPMDTWTGDLNPTVEDWVAAFDEIRANIDRGKYKVGVRLPQCFVKRAEFDRNPEYYGYCPVKLGERVMIHPNGQIRICSNLICSPFCIAKYYDNGTREIVWERGDTNEMLDHDLGTNTPCTNRGKASYGEFVPLCFSFKPNQDEIVWRDKLQWDKRRLSVAPVGVSNE